MTLKYERQWEAVEKAYNQRLDFYNHYYDGFPSDVNQIRKGIIQHFFNLSKYINWNDF